MIERNRWHDSRWRFLSQHLFHKRQDLQVKFCKGGQDTRVGSSEEALLSEFQNDEFRAGAGSICLGLV